MFPTIQDLSSNGCKVDLYKRQHEDYSDQHLKQDIRSYQRLTSHARSPSYKALFRSKKFLDFDTITLSFLFDKYCLIME